MSYFEGVTYDGLLGVGAGLGQQEAAMTAAMPAMKASFMCLISWFFDRNGMTRKPVGHKTSGGIRACKVKDEAEKLTSSLL